MMDVAPWTPDPINGQLFDYFLGDEPLEMMDDDVPMGVSPASITLKLELDEEVEALPAVQDAVAPAVSFSPLPSANAVKTESQMRANADGTSDDSDYDLLPNVQRRRGSSRPLGAPRRAPAAAATTTPRAASLAQSALESLASRKGKTDAPSRQSTPEDGDDKQLKNRDAARLFRQRRKDYLRNLEDEARKMRQRKLELDGQVKELEAANASLCGRVAELTSAMEDMSIRASGTERALESAQEELARVEQSSSALVLASASASSQGSSSDITIPSVNSLMQSLSIDQVAKVVMCLSIIASTIGPLAGSVAPSVSQSTEELLNSAIVDQQEPDEMEGEPMEEISTALVAAGPMESNVDSMAQASDQFMSRVVKSVEPQVLAYLVSAAVAKINTRAPMAMQA